MNNGSGDGKGEWGTGAFTIRRPLLFAVAGPRSLGQQRHRSGGEQGDGDRYERYSVAGSRRHAGGDDQTDRNDGHEGVGAEGVLSHRRAVWGVFALGE